MQITIWLVLLIHMSNAWQLYKVWHLDWGWRHPWRGRSVSSFSCAGVDAFFCKSHQTPLSRLFCQVKIVFHVIQQDVYLWCRRNVVFFSEFVPGRSELIYDLLIVVSWWDGEDSWDWPRHLLTLGRHQESPEAQSSIEGHGTGYLGGGVKMTNPNKINFTFKVLPMVFGPLDVEFGDFLEDILVSFPEFFEDVIYWS